MLFRTFRTLLFLSVIALVALTACHRQDASAPNLLFAASFQSLNNPVFIEINKGLEQTIAAHGGTLIACDAEFSHKKQLGDIDALLERNPSAIFINPVNWEEIKDCLIAAKRKKVPSIIVDAPVSNPDLVLCQVASDNVEAGRLACEALAQTKPDAKIVILHLSTNRACIERVAGFCAEMSRYPNMKIVDAQEGTGKAEGARRVMAELLKRYLEVDAVFAINDPSALGAVSAIQDFGRGRRVAVVTVDGSQEGIAAVQAGTLLATVAQDPRQIGRLAAEKAFAHLNGNIVEKNTRVPVRLISRNTTSR